MDQETIREIKRIELELGRLRKEDRLLRERISVASGDYSVDFFRQGSLGGTLIAGDGISGGGTFPGTVSIAIDLVSAWSGLEISSAQLRIDQTAAFTWTALHTYQNSPSITHDPQSDQDHTLFTINVTGTPTVFWDESENAISQSHDLVLESRCFGFAKFQNQYGRVGNGPVEYGEVAAICGVMEIAPGGALYEAVTIN